MPAVGDPGGFDIAAKAMITRPGRAIEGHKLPPVNVVFTRIVNDCSIIHGATSQASLQWHNGLRRVNQLTPVLKL